MRNSGSGAGDNPDAPVDVPRAQPSARRVYHTWSPPRQTPAGSTPDPIPAERDCRTTRLANAPAHLRGVGLFDGFPPGVVAAGVSRLWLDVLAFPACVRSRRHVTHFRFHLVRPQSYPPIPRRGAVPDILGRRDDLRPDSGRAAPQHQPADALLS